MSSADSTLGSGRYRKVEPIGEGGIGTVWRASQEPLGREVALKVLRPEHAQDPGLRRRFTREARAVAALNHPNIATVFDFGVEEDGTLFLAMEYVKGRSLARLMSEGLTARHLLAILDAVLVGLAHAHARGVIHRDLKPENILVAFASGEERVPTAQELAHTPQLVKLVDFGIATGRGIEGLGEGAETRAGVIVGTPLYMSPEQARGEGSLTAAADLYALGVLLYEGLCGRHPFVGLEPDETVMDIMIRHVTMPPPEMPVPHGVFVPEALRAVVRRLLQKKPADRYPSAAELRTALREVSALFEARAQHAALVGELAVKTQELDELDAVRPSGPTLPSLPAGVFAQEEVGLGRPDSPYLSAPDWSARGGPGVRFEVPLVARREERAALQSAVGRCLLENLGQLVLLEGEAGVGKTKLATWLKEKVSEAGQMRAVVGVFLRESGGGLHGLREAVENLFRVRGLDRAQVEARLAERLSTSEDPHARDVEQLTAFLRPRDSRENQGDSVQEALFALLLRVLERAAREQPLLILLDDIQWAGPELADLLEYLAVEFRYRPVPLMILCTIRSEELSANPRLARGVRRLARYEGETALRLQVERLGQEDSAKLVELILPLDESLERDIIARSEGNPLYLVQILQYLYQREGLKWDRAKARYSADESSELQQVPPSLADLLLLRLEQIERLHPESQGRLTGLLERAAVLGDRFVFEVLQQMIGLEGDARLESWVESGVDLLLHEAVLTQVKGRSEDLLQFNHGLIREALLQQMEGSRRLKRLHRLAGQAKEQFYGKRADAGQIAHHALAAGDRERALVFLMEAAHAARSANNLRAAAQGYAQAAQLVAELRGPSDPMLLTLGRRVASLVEGFGEFGAAERICAAMLRAALFEAPEPDPVLLDPLLAEDEEALTTPERQLLLEAARTSPRRASLEGSALEDVAIALFGMGRQARVQGHQSLAEDFLLEGVGLAQDGGLEGWATFGSIQLGWCAWDRGDYDTAESLAQDALETSQLRADAWNRADALHLLADIARMRGEPGRTAELITDARAAYEILGDRRRAAACLRDMASLARARQDLENAARLFSDARREFEELGDRHAAAMCLNGLGEVARFLGRLEVAESCYQRAYDTLRSIGARADAAIALLNLGQTALSAGELGKAQDSLLRAEALAGGRQQPYLTLGLHLNFALLGALQGFWDEARQHLKVALEQSDRHAISDPDYARPLEQLGSLFIEAGEEERGRDLQARARQMWAALGRKV